LTDVLLKEGVLRWDVNERTPPESAFWHSGIGGVYTRFVSAPFRKDKSVADQPGRPSGGLTSGQRNAGD
jgi:hypothetical protein